MDDETALMCAISMRVETRKKKKLKANTQSQMGREVKKNNNTHWHLQYIQYTHQVMQ